MSWKDKALAKLEAEQKTAQYDRYAKIMKNSVREALESFCRHDEEFAQAVVQGGTFEDCMKAVATNCGNGISDLEAYRRAAGSTSPARRSGSRCPSTSAGASRSRTAVRRSS